MDSGIWQGVAPVAPIAPATVPEGLSQEPVLLAHPQHLRSSTGFCDTFPCSPSMPLISPPPLQLNTHLLAAKAWLAALLGRQTPVLSWDPFPTYLEACRRHLHSHVGG